MATPAENKATSHRWFERVWNEHCCKAIYEMLGEDCIGHTEQGDFVGPGPFAEIHARFLEGFPDIHITIEDSIAEGDRVAVRWVAEGTNAGPFFGAGPSGQRHRFRGTTWHRYKNGCLAEGWDNWNQEALFDQIRRRACG